MSKNLFVSLKNTIGIREFMSEYLGVEYKKDRYLSHKMMIAYLMEKGYELPTRVNYNEVKEEDINSGKYIAVREETKNRKKGKILVYENPLEISDSKLLYELRQECDFDELVERRRKIMLESHNMFENYDGEILKFREDDFVYEDSNDEEYLEDEYDITVSVNRQKVYAMSSRNHLVERRKY